MSRVLLFNEIAPLDPLRALLCENVLLKIFTDAVNPAKAIAPPFVPAVFREMVVFSIEMLLLV